MKIGDIMLKRKIETKISQWFDSYLDKVLFIDGPRQVGKTYIIRDFCNKHFKNYVEINLIKEAKIKEGLKGVSTLQSFLLILSTYYDLKEDSNDTLIFLDEVQELDENDIITMLKFISEDSKRCFAISGSLLGVNLKNYTSWPTGYIFHLEMNSLDFEEFCWAFNVSPMVLEHLKDCFTNIIPVENSIHERVLDLFSLYIIIGGMPETVDKYLETQSIYHANIVLGLLNHAYEKDISKYEENNNKLYIKEIYNLIPSELNNKNKRFILKNLNEYTKFNKFDASFVWLNKAGITIPVYNANELNVPLELSKERTLFKLFHNDTGMLINLFADASIQINILKRAKSINFGSIYENVVAKELYVHGYNLFYYNDKKNGEVDFIIEDKNEIIPIEVKSGKDYTYHRALNNVIDDKFGINKAYVLSNNNVSLQGKICYLPIYMIMFFIKEKANDNLDLDKIKLDFSLLQ